MQEVQRCQCLTFLWEKKTNMSEGARGKADTENVVETPDPHTFFNHDNGGQKCARKLMKNSVFNAVFK